LKKVADRRAVDLAWRFCGVLALLLCAGQALAGDKGKYLFTLHCSGCHVRDGSGSTEGRIPRLAGQIGHFMKLPDGRRFVLQVPGIMNSGLHNAEIETLMNWLVPHFAGTSLDGDFVPYQPAEIEAARKNRPADIFAARRRIADDLRKQGVTIEDYYGGTR
jgi:hypothetical protein